MSRPRTHVRACEPDPREPGLPYGANKQLANSTHPTTLQSGVIYSSQNEERAIGGRTDARSIDLRRKGKVCDYGRPKSFL